MTTITWACPLSCGTDLEASSGSMTLECRRCLRWWSIRELAAGQPGSGHMLVTDDMITAAAEHFGTYAALQRQIAELEAKQAPERDAIIGLLFPDEPQPGHSFAFPGIGLVAVARGRVSTKLDRTVLAKAGVDPKLLDEATVRTEGKPSVRITCGEDNEAVGGA